MSALLAVKLIRDLRASWSRFVLMTIAIAVCLTAFGGVLFAWAAGGRETGGAYQSTGPASATILLDRPVDAARMAAVLAGLRTRPGVLEATGRTQFSSDVQVNGRPRAVPLQVFAAAPDDPMRMATFRVNDTTWPPAPGEILIGRDALGLLDVRTGDVVTIEAPGGGPVRLRVAGTVDDPSLSPSPQEQTGHAYLSTAALPGRQIGMDQVKIQVAGPGQAVPSRDRDTIVAVAGEVGRWLRDRHGLTIREIQVPTPYAHPHQWQADTLLLALLAGGAAALLLSSILVATILDTIFTRQIPQIGIMKAVGARSGVVARFYLAMTLLIAVAATLVALPLAVLLGRVTTRTFLGFLGIEPLSLAAPWWTYPIVLTAGLVLPPLMALLPVAKAARTTVRAAIDHHGTAATPGTTGLLTRLTAGGRLNRGLVLALRNTVRRPTRFWLSAGLMGAAGMVFVAGMSLTSGTQAIADEQKRRRTWDVDVNLAAPASPGEALAAVARVPGVQRADAFGVMPTSVAAVGQIPVTRTYPDQGHGRIAVIALPAGATSFTTPPLLEGRWLNPGETGAIVLNQVIRRNALPGVRAGDQVQLLLDGKPTTWRVVGLAQEREGGGLYTTADGLAAALGRPAQVNQLRVTTTRHDEPARDAIAAAVRAGLTGTGIAVRSAASVTRGDAVTAGHLGPVILILLGVALPLGVVGVIGLAGTMSANVLDRIREFGVMHAIGAGPRTVRRIVVTEGILLALASCLLATLPALALTAVLGAGLGDLFFAAPLPYRISLPGTFLWLLLALLGAALATEAAATRAARLTVREALTYL
ncbi:ABC transporter permease [Sphaerisporangium sp. B11E5]|uniref:ABC transporter permease n=1 Tax=Sphaerisporangium sp. B11E5 TaxID=3153563 RepID=UPI00325E4FCD